LNNCSHSGGLVLLEVVRVAESYVRIILPKLLWSAIRKICAMINYAVHLKGCSV
jgi:hypothetical protein